MRDPRRILNTILLLLLGAAALLAGTLCGGPWGTLIAALVIVLLLFLAAWLFVRFTLRRPGGTLTHVGPPDGPANTEAARVRAYSEEKQALLAPYAPEDIHMTSRDGLRLHGLFMPGAAGEARCVVLCHGYSRQALQMAEYAVYWRETFGFNVLMPDARAHGESGGRYAGMGWPDRLDLIDWIELAAERLGKGCRVALYGISMGGATVLMAGGEKGLPPQVKCIAEDCGYTDVYSEFRYQMQHRFHLPAFPILPLAGLWCRLLAGYGFRQASALRQAQRLALPTLFIHGEADTFVPFHMAEELYAAAAAPQKELIAVPGAAHVRAFWEDTSGSIRAALARYVEACMPPE